MQSFTQYGAVQYFDVPLQPSIPRQDLSSFPNINTGVSNNVAVNISVKAADLDCFTADVGFMQRHKMNTLYIIHDHAEAGNSKSLSNVGI